MNNRGNHQLDLPIQLQILNISVNMARMGEFVLKHGTGKEQLIKAFLEQTDSYLRDLESINISKTFKPTLSKFSEEFQKLKKEKISEKNKVVWAEKVITWADILQIRSRLA